MPNKYTTQIHNNTKKHTKPQITQTARFFILHWISKKSRQIGGPRYLIRAVIVRISSFLYCFFSPNKFLRPPEVDAFHFDLPCSRFFFFCLWWFPDLSTMVHSPLANADFKVNGRATELTIPGTFWEIADPVLSGALFGAFETHGIVSTRKAIAALTNVSNDVKYMVGQVEQSGVEVPDQRGQGSSSSSSEKWLSLHETGVKCSPCVFNTATVLVKKGIPVTPTDFFLQLCKTSCGPTISTWQRAGWTSERLRSSRVRSND